MTSPSTAPAPRFAFSVLDDALETLDSKGFARLEGVLDGASVRQLRALWTREDLFRRRVSMARHRLGEGSYRYFAQPLPEPLEAWSAELYRRLLPQARTWNRRLGEAWPAWPDTLAEYRRSQCASGTPEPAVFLLDYETNGYNRLHQDTYGPDGFPFQVTLLLSQPGTEFEGGEFLLLEQRPRTQARVHVVPLAAGDAVVFASRVRPERGLRGERRVVVRHGVATVRAGRRSTLGIVLHGSR